MDAPINDGHDADIIKRLNEDIRFWQGTDERALLELNKTLITLATGTIGVSVSVALLHDNNMPVWGFDVVVLLFAWMSLILTIWFILLSYNNHRKASRFRISYAAMVIEGDLPAEVQSLAEQFAAVTTRWTRLGQWTFVIGVFLTIVYFTLKFGKA